MRLNFAHTSTFSAREKDRVVCPKLGNLLSERKIQIVAIVARATRRRSDGDLKLLEHTVTVHVGFLFLRTKYSSDKSHRPIIAGFLYSRYAESKFLALCNAYMWATFDVYCWLHVLLQRIFG